MISFILKTRGLLGGLLVLLGICLLGIAAIGEWTPLGGGVNDSKRDWERFDPALVTQVRDYATMVKEADLKMDAGKTTDAAKMQVMFDLITDRFTHNEAQHNLASNWILYLAGYVHPIFRHMWNPDRFVSQGYSLLCDQSSYLLLHLAEAHGIKSRHVGLQGHVVMEAWYEGDWHLYDPDLEVIPLDEAGKVLSLDDLARNETLLQKYYGPHPRMADLVRNRANHLYMSTPAQARFEWKGNVLALLEKVTEVLKFLIPGVMILVGLRLLRRASTPAPAV